MGGGTATAAQHSGALRRPAPLSPGEVVCAIAPGGALPQADWQQGRQWLAQAGYAVREAVPQTNHLYYAGSRQARAEALQEAMHHTPCALWAVRGGSGAAQLLPMVPSLQTAALRRLCPWWVGFSDITAVHARVQAAGWQSVHGANLSNLPRWSVSAQQELLALLGPMPPTLGYAGRLLWSAGAKTNVRGPLMGGNLTTLAAMAGTGALPSWRGAIVLLEDIGEAPYRLDRALHQLWQAGHFDGAAGLALGQWTRCAATAGYGALELLEDTLQAIGLPTLADLPLGHEDHSRPILLGGLAEMDADAATMTVFPW